ncbi:hypothetical protein U2T52_004086 [Salmonella enterica]|nr:hypothetical protein [Salmonella enterica]
MMKLNMIQMKKVFLPVLLLSGLAGSTGVRAEVPAGGSSIPGSNVAVGLSGEVVRSTCSVTVPDTNFSFGVFHVNSSDANQILSRDTVFTITGCKGQEIFLSVKASMPSSLSGISTEIAPLSPPEIGHLCDNMGSLSDTPFTYSVNLKRPNAPDNLVNLWGSSRSAIQVDSDPYAFTLQTEVTFSGGDFHNSCGPDGGLIYGIYRGSYTYNLTYN